MKIAKNATLQQYRMFLCVRVCVRVYVHVYALYNVYVCV